eukprot:1154311-Amorphochlora_amoeboformis.AAC.3
MVAWTSRPTSQAYTSATIHIQHLLHTSPPPPPPPPPPPHLRFYAPFYPDDRHCAPPQCHRVGRDPCTTTIRKFTRAASLP